MGLIMLICLGQYYGQAMQGNFNWPDFIATYIGLVVYGVVWLGYRLTTKTRMVKYHEMEFPDVRKAP